MNIYIPDTLLGDTPLPHCAVSSHWRDTCVPNTLVSPCRPPITPPLPDWPVWEEEQDSLSPASFSSLLRKKKSLCALPLLA